MKITIIGVGNAGSTFAADLSLKGHQVTLLKTSDKLHNEHFRHLLSTKRIRVEENGRQNEVPLHMVTTDPCEALSKDTELIVVYVQTNYHEEVIRKIEPYVHDGQMILFEPGYLSTAYLLKNSKKRLISIEAESSPIDCRITAPGSCTVLFRNVRNPVGIYPHAQADHVFERLSELGYNFTLHKSVIEASLHNPNLIVHTVGAIMSVPRIEYSGGDYWMYREVFTPKICNLVERLDSEKIAILRKLQLPEVTYFEACRFRNSEQLDKDAMEVFFDYALHHSPKGPDVPDSRYITEDVSQGLCLIESLGHTLGISTPIATALIDMASAMLCFDFRAKGRNMDNLSPECVATIIRDSGYACFPPFVSDKES